MKKITSALASLLLVLPLVSVAALSSTTGQAVAPAELASDEQPSSTWRCCWVYHAGMWYCLPC